MIRIIPVLFFLILFITPISVAEPVTFSEKAEQHHEKTLKQCQRKSQPKWDTGNTMKMQEGTYDYLNCIRDQIIELAEIYFVEPNAQKNKDFFLRDLKRYSEQSLKLHEHIHTSSCSPCGTQHQIFYVMDTANDLESILKTMLNNTYENQLLADTKTVH